MSLLSMPGAIPNLPERVRRVRPSGRRRRRADGVLVVDDDPGVRACLRACLEHAGFVVWQAGRGEEAIDLCRAHGTAIDVVLLDVHMPGLDGPATLRRLRAIKPALRSFFMSD